MPPSPMSDFGPPAQGEYPKVKPDPADVRDPADVTPLMPLFLTSVFGSMISEEFNTLKISMGLQMKMEHNQHRQCFDNH